MTHLSGQYNIIELKHDVFGVMWKCFWGIYTHAEYLREWILHGDWLNDIPPRYYCFCIFGQLNYARILGKNLVHDTYGVK